MVANQTKEVAAVGDAAGSGAGDGRLVVDGGADRRRGDGRSTSHVAAPAPAWMAVLTSEVSLVASRGSQGLTSVL